MIQLNTIVITILICSVVAQNSGSYQNFRTNYQNPNNVAGQQYPQYQYQFQPQQQQQYKPVQSLPSYQFDQPQQYQQGPIQQYPQGQGSQYTQGSAQLYQQPQQQYQQGQIQQYPQGQGSQYTQGSAQLYQPPQQYQQGQPQSYQQGQFQQGQNLQQWQAFNSTTQYSGMSQSTLPYKSTTQPTFSVQYDNQAKDCTAPRVRGDFCSGTQQRQMFYFDSVQRICQPFMYNGCNGNGNRFESAAECKRICIDGNGATSLQRDDATAGLQASMRSACRAEYSTDHLIPQQCTTAGQSCSSGYQCNAGFCCPTSEYLCNLRYDSGKFAVGGEKSDRYFYTSQYRTCMRFSFYGTLGNENNFPDYNSCMRTCGVLAQQ